MKLLLPLVIISITALYSCAPEEVNYDSERDGFKTTDDIVTVPNTQGAAARLFLSDEEYKSLVIDIAYESSAPPTSSAIVNFLNFCTSTLDKPNGISYRLIPISDQGQYTYSRQELLDIESNYRKTYNTGDTLSLFIFFADGRSYKNFGNSIYFGENLGSNSFAIFERTIKTYTSSSYPNYSSELERLVALHCFGQLLGLVDNGTDAQSNHEHTSYQHTCKNSYCIMHWENVREDIIYNYVTSSYPYLGTSCASDLSSNGGL